jgi:hypothetical protein
MIKKNPVVRRGFFMPVLFANKLDESQVKFFEKNLQ